MTTPKFSVQELITLECALYFLLEGLPEDPRAHQAILDGLQRNGDLQEVWQKVKTELDVLNLRQKEETND